MSRRTKLLITASFLVLLAIPGIYIPLSWNPPAPLEFRYLSQGAPVMHAVIGVGEELCVPFQIEVRNTQPYPIHLWEAELHGDYVIVERPPPSASGETTDADEEALPIILYTHIGRYRSPAISSLGTYVEIGVPHVPARGSARVEIFIPEKDIRKTNLESLDINYASTSTTKLQALKFSQWLERKFGIHMGPYADHHQAPLQVQGTISVPAPTSP